MAITSLLAIYFIFWFLCLFLVLPFGVRTADEAGTQKVLGQADSAPAEFNFTKIALRTSLLAGILLALFYANYTQGWITLETLSNLYPSPNLN
jgi:predicted secreted protein